MNSESLNTAILQLLREVYDNLMFTIPTQACFCGYWYLHGVHHAASDFQHQRNVLQKACACAFPCYALHGAAEIHVENVGMGHFLNDFGSFGHCIGIFPIDLDGCGAFVVANL